MKSKTRQEIQANAKLKARLANMFNVTAQFVSLSLLFKRNSERAQAIRKAALVNGAELVNITVAENTLDTIKVLDNKGNVTRIIHNSKS